MEYWAMHPPYIMTTVLQRWLSVGSYFDTWPVSRGRGWGVVNISSTHEKHAVPPVW
jgi:hypothetical protein